MSSGFILPNVVPENNLKSDKYDAVLLVSSKTEQLTVNELKTTLSSALKCDPSLDTEVAILPLPSLPAGRLVHCPTGPIDPHYDDIRVISNAAKKGVKRALKAGIKKPLLVLEQHPLFKNAELVALLGALETLYTPIQVREHNPSKANKVDYLGVYTPNPDKTNFLVSQATTLESALRVARDIGDADPERMTPKRVEEYVINVFRNSPNIKIDVISDPAQIKKEYPLIEAVDRAASMQERHRGRVIFLEYNPSKTPKKTVFLVGKGVTYDTGGADVKINGAMIGMSRDKCGAAAVAGFMYLVSVLKPADLRVVAAMSMVRNSIGSNSYVADEVITARCGARVRIGNTDAEGRMAMADVLCKMKEIAVDAVDPHLFTIATLTGHAVRAVGEGYSIIMDNGPAKEADFAHALQKKADDIGDPFEVSTIRREDFDIHKGKMEGDDISQAEAKPSTMTCRGHQGPAAFLILASGLDKYGYGSNKPLKYSHIDIAGSSGSFPDGATGAPILALANQFLL